MVIQTTTDLIKKFQEIAETGPSLSTLMLS